LPSNVSVFLLFVLFFCFFAGFTIFFLRFPHSAQRAVPQRLGRF
jgi:hypothetical protein